jgi:hypothetical protein
MFAVCVENQVTMMYKSLCGLASGTRDVYNSTTTSECLFPFPQTLRNCEFLKMLQRNARCSVFLENAASTSCMILRGSWSPHLGCI